MVTPERIFSQFSQAVGRLDDALSLPKTDIVRDSAIHRFEYTFELAWKSIKVFLEAHHGVHCASPKGCLREAYRQQLLPNDELWLAMTDDRNAIAHMYLEAQAEKLYAKLPTYRDHLRELATILSNTQTTEGYAQ